MPDVVAKEAKTPEEKRLRRSRWIGIASGILVAGFIASVAYFGLQYLRDTSYQDERAFRVLGHIVGQFGNLQEAIAGSLQLAPGSQDCMPKPEQDQAKREVEQRLTEYKRRLALRGVQLSRDIPRQNSDEPFRINISSAARIFFVRSCDLTLTGSLLEQIPIFINQELFEAISIATQDGKVLATIPQGRDESQHVELHTLVGTDLFGGDAGGLLRTAALHEARMHQAPGKEEKAAATDRTTPAGATVYAEEVGGQPFRVFVLPFEPARRVLPFEPARHTVVDPNSHQQLYLIGLRRQDLLRSLSEALGSGGALLVTLGTLLCVLSWPFLSVRFSSPQEAIAPMQVFAILLALLLIPAVLATAGFSIWTRHRLVLWADQHAEIYAQRVEQVLIEEMDAGLHILESLTSQFTNNKAFRDNRFLMGEDGTTAACVPPRKCSHVLKVDRPQDSPNDWFPIRLAAPLNEDGHSSGLTLSFFGAEPPQRLDLQDREYYAAIMAGEEWLPRDLWPHESEKTSNHKYVAQRLFNRSDAARALQLTIPLDVKEGKVPLDAKRGERIGLLTGDTRAYGLSADLRPPLLRFAIFDQRNGALVFHTNDERSLAENLVVETEENPSLIKAMQKRASRWSQSRVLLDDHFTGRYTGSAHRFYHRAVTGAPWGLIVFYETDALNTIVLQTAMATLATYFAVISSAAVLFALVALLSRSRTDIELLRWVWPKWSSRDRYRMIRLVGIVVLAGLALVELSALRQQPSPYFLALLALIIVGAGTVVALRVIPALLANRPPARAPSFTTYKRSYVQSMFVVLSLVSAVPAVVIAIGYHDTSVHALIRDELLQAARDEEQRRRMLLRDDRRFNNSSSVDLQRAVKRSQTLKVPGYQYGSIPNGKRQSWMLIDSDPAPWLFRCGPPMLDPYRRLVWALSTPRQVQRPLRVEGEQRRTCSALAVQAWRRSEDGTLVSMALPLKPLSNDFTSIEECKGNRPVSRLCRDPELHTLYEVANDIVLLSVTIGCALLILLLSAHVSRRLFGVRIPFSGRFVPSEADAANASALLDAELELVKLKKTAGLQMTSKDEADWRAQKCMPIYQRMWNSLESAKEQQLLLLHLAHGRYANPENQAVIEGLLRRGYIALAPWPRIIEPGFAEFICRVHPSHDLDELRFEASHTPWSRWRTPILIIVIFVAGLLMWLAGGAMHILVGVLGGIATLFGSITQVTGFIHRDKPAPDK